MFYSTFQISIISFYFLFHKSSTQSQTTHSPTEHMTSLCHICTARPLHCITFKITEILFTCDCKSSLLKFIPWMLLIPSTYLYMWGSYFNFGKGQYTLCQLVPAAFLTSPAKDWAAKLVMPYHSPHFSFYWIPSSLHALQFISSRAGCHGGNASLLLCVCF